MILRQNSAVDVLIGPFVDSADGYTPEVGVSPAVKLSKGGQALAAKTDATTPVHDADGYYNCELDATDTNTIGTLVLSVVGSATSLAVRHEYQVVEEAVYDSFYAASAAGCLSAAEVNAEVDAALVDIKLDHLVAVATADDAVDGSIIAAIASGTADWSTFNSNTDALETIRLRGDAAWVTGAGGSSPTVEEIRIEMDANSTQLTAIVADTGELQTDWTNGGRLDLIVDAILADTGTDGVVISATTANQIADAILKRDWTAVSGEAARSALNALRFLRNKWSIAGTTLTVTEEDDSTQAWTATVSTDAAAEPVTGNDPA